MADHTEDTVLLDRKEIETGDQGWKTKSGGRTGRIERIDEHMACIPLPPKISRDHRNDRFADVLVIPIVLYHQSGSNFRLACVREGKIDDYDITSMDHDLFPYFSW